MTVCPESAPRSRLSARCAMNERIKSSVLDSILMFTGLLSGQAGYSCGDWARALAWSGFGNLVGGVGLVTSIRLLRTPHRVAEERDGQS